MHCRHYDRVRWAGPDIYGCRQCQDAAHAAKKEALFMGGDEKFIVKDSGERQQFGSGMQRDVTVGKPRFDLCFDGPMMERYAEHLRKGAEKYTPQNWMKADSVEEMDRFRQSAARHFAQWMAGNTDEDHAAAVIFNLNGYEYVKARLAGKTNPAEMVKLPCGCLLDPATGTTMMVSSAPGLDTKNLYARPGRFIPVDGNPADHSEHSGGTPCS